ncbi:MAG TPA: phosphoesterase PA-phosphatase, partial [Hanamia sp.]|nr:phosphoesterase PA-phosphatase [Hanamia sp.]
MKKLYLLCFVICAFWGCTSKNDYADIFKNPDLFSKTVYQLNGVVMGNNFSPIVASRNYLYASVAAYEVIAAGYPNHYRSLAGQVNGLPALPKPETDKKIDFEFASLLAYCNLGSSVTFPEGSMDEYVDSLKKLATDHGMPSDMLKNSVAFSDTISEAILAWSKKDNYAQTRSSEKYSVTDEPGRWVP